MGIPFLNQASRLLLPFEGVARSTDPTGSGGIPTPYVPSYYLPTSLTFITWDAPVIAYQGINVDYKMTGYDWFNRPLVWSLTAFPSGATISANGTISWTPSAQGTFNFTVRMTAGATVINKSFTVEVNNAKCIFVSTTGNDTTGNGTLANPYATLQKVGTVITNNNGRLVFMRGGDYTLVDARWWNDTAGTGYRLLANSTFSKTDPLVIRNYPTESPRLVLTGDLCQGATLGVGNIYMGIEITGGKGAEAGGLIVGTDGVAKNMVVRDYQAANSGNCTGVYASSNAILDSVTAYDNYDRAALTFHNSSNFLFYCEKGGGGDIMVIDCVSAGYSVVGFKLKHAGSVSNLHIHRCVSYGSLLPYGGADNGSSVRHSMFYRNSSLAAASDGAYAFGESLTDQTTGGFNNLSVGMLCDQNTLINDVVGTDARALQQAGYVGIDTSSTPCQYLNNKIQVAASIGGAIFAFDTYSASPSPTWTMVFSNNDCRAPALSTAYRKGTTNYPATDLNNFGTGNSFSTTPNNYTMSIANATWTYTAGVFAKNGTPI